MKKVLLLLEKGINEIPDNYIKFYEHLFDLGFQKDINIIISSPYNYDYVEKVFLKSWNIKSGKFVIQSNKYSPDIVWYKSNDIHFLVNEIFKTFKFINNISYILLAADKYETSLIFSKTSPITLKLDDILKNKDLLNEIKTDKVVLKPNYGIGGKGIYINTKKELLKNIKSGEDFNSYIAQDFIDSSNGIKGIVKGTFDLRFVVIGNKISYTYFRTPPKGDFRCNYSLGGNMKIIDIKILPYNIINQINNIINTLSGMAFIYSIDVTTQGEKLYLVELNSSPGIAFNEEDKKTQINFFTDIIELFKNFN